MKGVCWCEGEGDGFTSIIFVIFRLCWCWGEKLYWRKAVSSVIPDNTWQCIIRRKQYHGHFWYLFSPYYQVMRGLGTEHNAGTTFIGMYLLIFFVLFVFNRGLILPSGFGSKILLAERLQWTMTRPDQGWADKNTTLKFQPSLERIWGSDLKLLREKLHRVFILNI